MTCVAILVVFATIAGLVLIAVLTILRATLRAIFIAGTTEIPGMGRLWRIDMSTIPERGMAVLIAHNTRAFQSFARSLPSHPASLVTAVIGDDAINEGLINDDSINEDAINEEARRQLDALSSKLRTAALHSLLWRSPRKELPEQYIYVTQLVYYLADIAAPNILDKLEAIL